MGELGRFSIKTRAGRTTLLQSKIDNVLDYRGVNSDRSEVRGMKKKMLGRDSPYSVFLLLVRSPNVSKDLYRPTAIIKSL